MNYYTHQKHSARTKKGIVYEFYRNGSLRLAVDAAMTKETSAQLGKRAFSETSRSVRTATVKYKTYTNKEAAVDAKTLPSQLIQQINKPPVTVEGTRPKPRIIELLNISDYTHHVDCIVGMDEPIFQPFPPEVSFYEYEPFRTYESILYLRNNDRAARRVKVLPPASPYFSVARLQRGGVDSDEGTKVAYGMEVAYLITFKPDSFDDYHYDMVVCTEREKFLVPIISRGRRAALDLPDTVEFDATPARGSSTQSFVVTNVGQRKSQFTLKATGPFTVVPTEGALGPSESLQVSVSFAPPSVGEYRGELVAQYDTGEVAHGNLVGYGAKLDVTLSSDQVSLLPTFLGKMSQRTLRIVNGSSRPVEFCWKRAASVEKEADGYRSRIEALQQKEAAEAQQERGEAGLGYGEEELEASSDEEDRLLSSKLATTTQRFKRLRREVHRDRNLFEDPIIALSPLEGTIGPNGEVEITVQFRPTLAQEHNARAFCEVTGLGHRLPLSIRGKGLGPKAVFSFDVLDVGETFVNTVHQYEVELHNRGDIDTNFSILPLASPFGKRFSFQPRQGPLLAGRTVPIQIQFLSSELGSFNESFKCEIDGSVDPIAVEFKGRVVGPSFSIDTDELAFGTVAFGFRYQRTATIRNTSEVPLRYALRLPGDTHKEFRVEPASGTVPPMGQQEITLEIEPKKVTLYRLELAVDVIGVGHAVKTVPVSAESAVPAVALDTGGIDFGECFMKYGYNQRVEIKNLHGNLPAKFEALPQDDQSKSLGQVLVEPAKGEVEPGDSAFVDVTMTPLRRGKIQLPLRFLIHGAGRDPLECVLVATAIGPLLTFEDENGQKLSSAVMEFGQRPVLRKHTKTLRWRNTSPIPAEFKAFCEGASKIFSVEPREGLLEPGQSVDLRVSCFMDDCLPFKDTLHLLITDGEDVTVPLRAQGSGTTVVVEELESQAGAVELGPQFVGRPFTRDFSLRNMSRRPQQITWIAVTRDAIIRNRTRVPKKDENGEPVDRPPEPEIVFSITPERANLSPGQKLEFSINGIAQATGPKAEKFLLRTNVGKLNFDVTTLEFRAEVGQPLLLFSHPNGIHFQYWCDPNAPPSVMTETLSITNQSQLPLSFNLRPTQPFVIDRPDWSLDPGTSCSVKVAFDPGFRSDKSSQLLKSKMAITYQEAPQKDSLDLVGEVNFPNLSLESTHVDFSSVLVDTVRRRHVTITNVSKVPCSFQWAFVDTSPADGGSDSGRTPRSSAGAGRHPSSAVDILPLSGLLQPGASEVVEFCFFAHPGTRLDSTAVCEVLGGPEYEVKLTGEASVVKYSLDTSLVDIGSVPYDRVVEKEVVLQNTGRVPFDYRVNLAKLTRPGVVTLAPSGGSLGPGGRDVLRMKVRVGIPDRISEMVLVEVAHCESEIIQVIGEGVYPSAVLSLPRQADDYYTAAQEEAKQRLLARGPALSSPLKTGVGFAAGLVGGGGTRKGSMGDVSRAVSRSASRADMGSPERKASMRNLGEGTIERSPSKRFGATRAGPSTMQMHPMGLVDYVPTAAEVEIEADRLRLCQILTEQALAKSAAMASPPGTARAGTRAATAAITEADTASVDPSSNGAPKQKNAISWSSVAQYVKATGKTVAAQYLLDFGYVTRGTTKTKRFRVQNTSHSPMYLSMDKKVLSPASLVAEPEAVNKLPGAPEYASVTVALTFNTAKASVQPGPMQCLVPVEVKGGPTIMVTVKAVVVVPELRLSREVLDFGSIQAGLCKVITLQLHNPKEVPCEWSIRKPTEGIQDWAFFQCTPDAGVVPPGGRSKVKIIFTPSRGRERSYSQRLPLKVNYNPRQITLAATGAAHALRVQLTSPALDLGPIIPKFEGQAPKKTQVELHNPCSQPVEVFCIETDKQYRDEEDLLRRFRGFDGNGTALVTVRAPGRPFWEDVRQAIERDEAAMLEEEEGARRASQEGEEGDAGAEGAPTEAEGIATPRGSEAPSMMGAGVGELEHATSGEALYFLVVGNDQAVPEKADIVKGLEKRYKMVALTIDALISGLKTREPGTVPEEVLSLLAEPTLDETQLLQVISAALGTEALERGFIISSFRNNFASKDVAIRAVLRAVGLRPLEDPKAEHAGGKKAPPAKGKGKEEAPAAPEVAELAWEGEKTVRAVSVTVGKEEFLRRRRTALEAERSAALVAAPAADGMSDGAEAAPAPVDEAAEAAALEQAWSEYEAETRRVTGIITTPAAAEVASSVELHAARCGPATTGAELLSQVIGFKWDRDTLTTTLPRAESDAHLLPPEYLLHVVHRPTQRAPRSPSKQFTLYTVYDTPPPDMLPEQPVPEKKGKPSKGASSLAMAPPVPTGPVLRESTRWVIPPGGSVKLEVHFASGEVGQFTDAFNFEVIDGAMDSHQALTCRGTCSYPQISRDFRNVFYRKIKTKPAPQLVSRQYIIATDQFDFGPLLMSAKRPEKDFQLIPNAQDNTTRLRITNSGHFECQVEFKFKSTGKAAGTVFMAWPEGMDLKADETQELQVFAFPTADGRVEDVLECIVKDNPQPVTFSMACTGTKPALKVEGPDAKGAVVFERLLLGKKETKTVTLTNTSLLPLVWELEGADKVPPEVSVAPQRGELAAMTEVPVLIDFSAIDPKAVTAPLKLKVFDAKKAQPAVQDIPITVQGESFEIKIKPTFPDADPTRQAVDFGVLRVIEDKEKEIALENTGKYAVGFRFNFSKGTPLRDLITILGPDGKVLTGEGQVDPGKKVVVKLHFNRERSLRQEVHIRDCYDLSLQYIEKLTNTVEQKVPIKVDIVAVYSKYSITPARGLSFGPTTYKTQSKPRVFEVQNLGVFPFEFRVVDAKSPPPPEDLASQFAGPGRPSTAKKDDKAAKGGKTPAKGAPEPVVTLNVGPFVVEPSFAVVQPGTSLQVKALFNADGDRPYSETLALHISERDFDDQPGGMQYELSGESCIPGINASDVDTIFEEHRLLNSLDPFNPVPLAFYKRERLFDFGPVVAQLSDGPATAEPVPAAKAPPKSANKAAKDATPEPPPPAVEEDEEEKSRGVRANLRISNPTKVPCTVLFSLTPRGEAAGFPMTVLTPKVDIPPHEYRYITVRFSPTAIQSYAAVFDAKVENGGDPRTQSFSCELRGEGVLPHVTVAEPSLRGPTGKPLLKFSRLLVGRERSLPLVLRNDGLLPASFRLDFPPSPAFRITGGPPAQVLAPRSSYEYQVTFAPQAADQYAHTTTIAVKHNQFEKVTLECAGEGYREDVIFEGLPGDAADSDLLEFADTAVGAAARAAFNLRNLSDRAFRFSWVPSDAPPPAVDPKAKGKAAPAAAAGPALPPGLEFSPAVGHLHPGASKLIVATFKPVTKTKLNEQPVALKIEEISFAEISGEPEDWDDKAVVVEFDDAGEERVVPKDEPKTSVLPNTAKSLTLKVSAAADLSQYQSDTTPINFKPTMMFQTRTFTFPLKNTGEARMPFRFDVLNADRSPDTIGFFTVEPASGEVEAGKEVTITVRFAPTEVEDCDQLLVCDIPHLADGVVALERPLTGRVQRPWCHMELPEVSDYLSSGRRNPEMKGPSGLLGPLDPATRVLEFESLGFRIRNTRRFFVLNPTSIAYSFVWEPAGASDDRPSPFRCQTLRGTISGGRRFEMIFDFTPEEDELREAHWVFRIPDQGISVPFLLVGNVKEPSVSLDRSAINFGLIQVGARGREVIHLVNGEDVPFQFQLDKESFEATEARLISTGRRPLLDFEPAAGVVPPRSSLPITVTYAPTEEFGINYNVICNVRKKPSRLTLNVKGEGFHIHEALQVEAADGVPLELTPGGPNQLDLGRVLVNERSVKQVSIVNSGNVNLEFTWSTGDNPRVSVRPDTGKVRKGERFICELAYSPHRPETLSDYPVTCQILNGHKYTLNLKGEGHKPRLNLSWYQQDFGPTLLWEPGMPDATAILRARNDDRQEISFDVLYDNRPHLSVGATATILRPGEQADIPVVFRPDRLGKFEEVVPLEVNGLYTINLQIKGEGVPLKLEVARGGSEASTSAAVTANGLPAIPLGSLKVGSSSTRIAKISNRGRVPVTINLGPSLDALARRGIEVVPSGETLVRAKEELDLTLFFRPTERIRPFADEIIAKVHGVEQRLMVLTGACLGTELKLATDQLPFGAVVLGSRLSKRVQLENAGDVGTKFSWDVNSFGPHFKVVPSEGFLAPGKDIKLEVTFCPLDVSPDIRVDRLRLSVDSGEDRFLTLTGSCVTQEPQGETVQFSTHVREEVQQALTLKNTTSTDWSLRPVITNDAWSGAEFIGVKAGQTAQYSLTYRPMTMSTKEQPHEGSVFFPLPDGTGMLYRLLGVAEQPLPAGSVDHAIAAKAPHTETFRVRNWSKKAQRFEVIVDLAQTNKTVQITAPKHVDVPGLSERDIKVQLVTYLEGRLQGRVTFRNASTGEYLFYEVGFTAAKPGLRSTLKLEAPVRQLASATVIVDNPLSEEVTLEAKCSEPQVIVSAQITLRPKSQQSIEVRYRPLLVGDKDATLNIQGAELGLFEYKLQLRGIPTGPERGLEFNVPLGSSETKKFRFINWFEGKSEYACAFRDKGIAGFTSESKVPSLKAGAEVGLDVSFEPTAIGEHFKDVLLVQSAEGGLYECPVVGRCLPPKPKGPIDLKNGAGAVPFKNVFAKDKDFAYSVDNPAFTVKPGEAIKAKSSVTIGVAFKEVPGQPRTGKLTVTCPGVPVPWVFYLRA